MNRVLLVRLGALGDIVHAIPVAAALRRAFPAARIDWLVSEKHRAILDLVPVIDRRLVVDVAPRVLPSLGIGARWTARTHPAPADSTATDRSARRLRHTTWLDVVRELRRSRYDVAIDLQGLVKSAALARSAGADRVVGFAASYLRERLARPLYTDVYDPGCSGIYDPRETRHVVDINLGLLEPLGITAVQPEFPLDHVNSAVANHVNERTGGRYVLLNPGANWPNKRWPPSRLGRVAAALRERHGLTSIALWGQGERQLADEIAAHSDGAALAAPPGSIADLVALSRGAALVVSGDTGPMHIAAAVGTPIVGIFGPTRPSRNGPWAAADVTVSRDSVCRCHHLRRCRLATMCLLDITVEEIVAAAERRLAADARGV